jgi:YebC/PmpR family DNA-binding regulatory protein
VSGHSKWATIKRKKGAKDAQRGRLFTRLAKEITIAARDGGGDPEMNARLRVAVNNAKTQNMPNDNIDRAIKRGTGDIEGVVYEERVYAGYYAGVAILIDAVTDNNNRTTAEVRHIFNKYNGKMVDTGSASVYFEQKGIITLSAEVADEEKVMEIVIDAGAEDVSTEDGVVTVTTPREAMHAVSRTLEDAGIAVESVDLQYVPNNTVAVTGEDASGLMRIITMLDELDDVSSVAANYEIDDAEMARLQEQFG